MHPPLISLEILHASDTTDFKMQHWYVQIVTFVCVVPWKANFVLNKDTAVEKQSKFIAQAHC